jgi:hypothetical protein
MPDLKTLLLIDAVGKGGPGSGIVGHTTPRERAERMASYGRYQDAAKKADNASAEARLQTDKAHSAMSLVLAHGAAARAHQVAAAAHREAARAATGAQMTGKAFMHNDAASYHDAQAASHLASSRMPGGYQAGVHISANIPGSATGFRAAA